MRRLVIGLLFGLSLLAPGMAQAQTFYSIEPILRQGDKIGEPPIQVDSYLAADALNDAGQIVINTLPVSNQSIIQYSAGKFSLILSGGREAPGGTWPEAPATWEPFSMTRDGNVIFSAQISIAGETSIGTFLWDRQTQKTSALLLRGMPAVNGLPFDEGGGWAPVINNRGEIALVGGVNNAAGTTRPAVFFRGEGGGMLPVAVPDQPLPGGGKVDRAWLPSLNDAGVVGFVARRTGETREGAYLWQAGELTALAGIETDIPGSDRIATVRGVWVNNKNRNALLSVGVTVDGVTSDALYLFAGGKLTPVIVAGQEMPGGGKLKSLQLGLGQTWPVGVSSASDAGKHAFLGQLEDGATAAYLMDVDGSLSLILKSGTATPFGVITRVGAKDPADTDAANAIALNGKGQVAFSVHVADDSGSGREMLVLLTPSVL